MEQLWLNFYHVSLTGTTAKEYLEQQALVQTAEEVDCF